MLSRCVSERSELSCSVASHARWCTSWLEQVSWVADMDNSIVEPCAICLATGVHILWSSHGMFRAEMVDNAPRFRKVHPYLYAQMTVQSGYTC